MKKLILTATALLISSANFVHAYTSVGATDCWPDALKVATLIDESAWGKGSALDFVGSSSTDNYATFEIKSPVSGLIYTVDLYKDLKSKSCVITSVVSK